MEMVYTNLLYQLILRHAFRLPLATIAQSSLIRLTASLNSKTQSPNPAVALHDLEPLGAGKRACANALNPA